MTTFALASEYHRLTSAQRDQIDHIIADDGDWTADQIQSYINQWPVHTCEADVKQERKEGWL